MSGGNKLNGPLNLKHISDAEMYLLSAKEGDKYYNTDLKQDVEYNGVERIAVLYEKPYKILLNEDWESGTFTANGWNTVNDTDNYRIVGDDESYEGDYSCYITNDGSTPGYDISASNVSHKYIDISIPAGSIEGKLTIYTRVGGENNYDYLRIFHTDTSHTPVAGTQPGSGYNNISGDLVLESGYTKHEYTFDVSGYAGGTMRMVMTWRNDGSVGTQPGAIDDAITFGVL